MRVWTIAAVACSALISCTGNHTDFPVTPDAQKAAVSSTSVPLTIVPLTGQNANDVSRPMATSQSTTRMPEITKWDYKVGPGDILDVVVWDHPELTLPAGPQRSATDSGQQVQTDGTFFYPYVGQVPAKGLTPSEIRVNLTTRLAKYIPDPQVVVRVVGYNSQSVSVTGEVTKPTNLPITSLPLTLVQGIDAAGGLKETADPAHVMVRRNGKVYNVDFQSFLRRGNSTNNPILKNGDVVNVPRLAVQQAFLLGQLAKPATVDLSLDPVNLTQALTTVGGLNENTADARGVFVFRHTNTGITVYQLDASSPVALVLGTKFYLRPQDVVYVTSAPIAKWNAAIAAILPSITALYQVSYTRKQF
jgi:polysaccharide biosynthesis/export protein